MATVHPKASAFAATGWFSGLNSLAELEVRISALQDEKQRGDAFEVFAGAWVALFYPQNVASQQFWPLDAGLAARLNVDALCHLGIDSILEIDGHLSAIQVKFRGGRKDLSWTELATFPGLSERADYRLVLSNGYATADTAKERDRTGFIGAETFDVLMPEDFELLAQWQWPGPPLARG